MLWNTTSALLIGSLVFLSPAFSEQKSLDKPLLNISKSISNKLAKDKNSLHVTKGGDVTVVSGISVTNKTNTTLTIQERQELRQSIQAAGREIYHK